MPPAVGPIAGPADKKLLLRHTAQQVIHPVVRLMVSGLVSRTAGDYALEQPQVGPVFWVEPDEDASEADKRRRVLHGLTPSADHSE